MEYDLTALRSRLFRLHTGQKRVTRKTLKKIYHIFVLCDVEIGRAAEIAEQIKLRKREMANDYLILSPRMEGFWMSCVFFSFPRENIALLDMVTIFGIEL